ncbi:hypothetical protein [Acidovorax sp. Q11]
MDDSLWPMTTTPLDWMRCSVPSADDDGEDGAADWAHTLPPPVPPNANASIAAPTLAPSLLPTVVNAMTFTFIQEAAAPGRLEIVARKESCRHPLDIQQRRAQQTVTVSR